MSPLPAAVAAHLDGHRVGVLATSSAGGRVHQSPVYFVRDGDELLVSTLASRLKARDVGETAWASLCVAGGEPPFPSATVSGPASIRTAGIGAATARVAQRIMDSEEPPEAQSDEVLAAAERVILALRVERVGPVSYLDG